MNRLLFLPLMLAAPVAGQDVPSNTSDQDAVARNTVPPEASSANTVAPADPTPAQPAANDAAEAPPARDEPAPRDEAPATVAEPAVDPQAIANGAASATTNNAAAPAPVAEPAPTPTANAAAAAAAAPTPPASADAGRTSWFWALLGVGALAVGASAVRLLRRNRTRPAAAPRPANAPMRPPAPAPPRAEPRARIVAEFRPARIGLNLLTATAEGEFVLRNEGDLAAADIRFGALLLPAHAQQADELAELWAGGVTRPVVPPFAMAPGEERSVRHLLTLPRQAIEPLDAGGRPMFVPVVAVSAVYDRGDGQEGQAGRAWVVGIERAESPKLAPLWLDQPPRTRDDVGARPHAASVDR